MAIIVGLNREPFSNSFRYELYLRDNRGYKYRIILYEDSNMGIKDLYMCASIPVMTRDEYLSLPDKVELEVIREICNNSFL